MLSALLDRLRGRSPAPADSVPAPLPPAADTYPASDEDVRIAALTVWGEARGDSYAGKVGVAWVIRNRADFARNFLVRRARAHPLFGDGTIESVCLTPRQFSCWNEDDRYNRPFMVGEKPMTAIDADALLECRRAVLAVLGGAVADPTHGSRHYHTPGVAPHWTRGRTPVAAIGGHLFFNDIA